MPFPLGVSSNGDGYTFLVQATDLTTCPGTCIRPVGLAFGADGRLYVSSDSSGEVRLSTFSELRSKMFLNSYL